jgi:hypothetical protein
MGGFVNQDNTFYSNLITFVLGVWVPSPTMKKPPVVLPKEKKPPGNLTNVVIKDEPEQI